MSGFSFPPPPPPPPNSNQAYQSASRGNGRGRGRGGPRGRGTFESRGRGGRGGNNNSRGHYQGSNNNLHSSNVQYSGYANNNPISEQAAGPAAGPHANHIIQQTTQSQEYSSLQSGVQMTSESAHASPARTVAGHKRKLDALRGPQPLKRPGPPPAPSIPSFGAPILPAKPPPVLEDSRGGEKKRTVNVLGLTPQNGVPQQYSSDSEEDDEALDEEAMFAQLGSNLSFEHNGVVMSLNSAADLAIWKAERARNFPTKARMAAKMEEKRQIGEERRRLLKEASSALASSRQVRNRTIKESNPNQSSNEQGSVMGTSNASSVRSHEPPPSRTPLEQARHEVSSQAQKLAELRQRVIASQIQRKSSQDVIDVSNLEQQQVLQAVNAGSADQDQKLDSSLQSPLNIDKHEQPQHTHVLIDTLPGETTDHQREDSAEPSDDSDSSSEFSSESTDPDSEDDGPPEEVTSKQHSDPATRTVLCRFFVASGYCRDGDACRFRHELPPRGQRDATKTKTPGELQQSRNPHSKDSQLESMAKKGRMSIHDLLIEQEQNEEDRLALKVIKYLGKMDFFAQEQRGSGTPD